MIINENELLNIIDNCKSIYLLEPPYRRKYIPLGLAKIASYAKEKGCDVTFGRGYQGESCDAVFATSLFTYDSQKVIDSILPISFMNPNIPIVVGGIYASLMPKHIEKHVSQDIMIFRGYSNTLDQCIPDYTIDYGIDDKWKDFSFTFTSRGCPNNCAYCAVWRIEPKQWINPRWADCIVVHKRYAMISDNNLSAQPMEHIHSVIDHLVDNNLRAVFDNGFDCKHVDDEFAQALSRVKYTRSGLRLAFDRIEEDGVFQQAVNRIKDAGAPKSAIMAYILFNFKDKPKDAYYRLSTCVNLGIRPYPQMFTPLNKTNRDDMYVGEYWTANLARAFRRYGIFAGVHTKMSFDEFIYTPEVADKLTDRDYSAWEVN